MYQVLARKWRPRNFDEVVGQGHVTRTLANAIEADRLAHAYIFAGLDGITRPGKPREVGLTMVVDHGMGPHAQEDLLTIGGDYIDFAKIMVGMTRLLSNEVLTAKIELYRSKQVEPFPGGQYLEYAETQGKATFYFFYLFSLVSTYFFLVSTPFSFRFLGNVW